MLDAGRVIEDRAMRDRLGVFEDRIDAGRRLAAILSSVETTEDAVVCAIPAGGCRRRLRWRGRSKPRFGLR